MLAQRELTPEYLDDWEISGEAVDRNMVELEMVNRWLGGYSSVIDPLKNLLKESNTDAPVSIADFGCGGGDTLKAIQKWAEKEKVKLHLTGIDANDYIISYAKQYSSSGNIEYISEDFFSEKIKNRKFDIIICSQTCHHFADEDLVRLFSQMHRQCRYGFIINDLHRHPVAYYGIKLLTRLFSRCEYVKHDGPVSVTRAFKKSELEQLLKKAGINNYEIEWRWAFRWVVEVKK